ncbi:O-antigen ligase family protein [Rhizobium sp. FKL33]|uniref:O-antigen ligase family protein n=1 Tax=Rhizobium sp. FKL33 TaxID=2562307 RepID=UPI0010BFB742|nr:O-antigen ligase family protein [Rhizobium sp. FKL33]
MAKLFSHSVSWLERVLRIVYLILFPALLLPFGSVEPGPLHLLALFSFLVTVLSVLIAAPSTGNRFAFAVAAFLAFALAGWVLFQASDYAPDSLVNAIWRTSAAYYGPSHHSISVAPADTMQGLIAVLLPFSVFLSGICLFRQDEQALKMIRFLALTGGAIAAFGLIQFLFFPDSLMFEKKRLYLGDLTAVFVNRNTAATYLGMSTLFACALAFHHVQNAGLGNLWRRMIGARSATKTPDALWTALYMLCAALALSAMSLTRSRAGLAATMVGLLFIVFMFSFLGGQQSMQSRKSGFSSSRPKLGFRLARAFIAIAVVIGIGLLFSGRALLRAETQGTEDARFCIMPGLLRLADDNLLTGTGLGTFRMVFPAYKDAACGLYGTWERAHNFYLDGVIALGLPFLVATLITVVCLIWIFARGISARRKLRWAPVLGLSILILQMLHNIVDFSIQIPAVAAVFAGALAACVSLSTNRGSTSTRRVKRSETVAN